MKASELRKMNEQELRDELLELRREQFNLRMQRATGQLGAPARFNEVRKDIARIETIMNEKARAATQATTQAANQGASQ